MSRRNQKRGVVLLIVLSLLVLFILVGVTFVVVAGHYRRGAESVARYGRAGDDPRKLFEIAAKQLIRGTTNERSALLGQSLLRDFYGTDGLHGIVRGAAEQAGGQFILIRYVPERGATPSSIDDFYNGRVVTVLDTMWHPGFGKAWGAPGFADNGGAVDDISEAGWANSDDQLTHGHRWLPKVPGSSAPAAWGVPGVDDNSDGIIDDLWEAGWIGSDDIYLTGSSHAGIGHMVHPGPDGEWGRAGVDDDDDMGNIGVAQRDESDEAGWPNSDDGFISAPRVSSRIVDSGNDATAGFWIRIEAFETEFSTRMLPTAGTRIVINGAPFNGTGNGYDTRHPTQNIDSYLPLGAGADGKWGVDGVDDDGDGTPDTDSDEVAWPAASDPPWPALPAAVSPPPDDFLMPTALAPNLSAYLAMPFSATSNPLVGGADESWDAVDFQNMFLAMVPGDSTATAYVIPSFHRPALINYLRALSSASTNPPFGGMWSQPAVQRVATMRPLAFDHPNFTGSNPTFDPVVGPWDVDNDGDGVRDSIWIDIGLPLQTLPDGRKVKPLVAILCKDLDGRLNLNFHGNYAHGNVARYGPSTRIPNSGVAPFAGAVPSFSTRLPRGSGEGPAEIYLGHILGSSYGPTLNRRSGQDTVPGRRIAGVTSDDPLSLIKHSRIPNDWSATGREYGSPPDIWGRGVTALDYFGQPMTWYMGLTGEQNENPYQASLDGVATGVDDDLFTIAELERILRWYDLDQNMLSGGLKQVTSSTFSSDVNRASVTTRSSHVPVPNLALTSDMRARAGLATSITQANLVDYYAALLGGMAIATKNTQIKNALPFEIRQGGLMDVNRPWGNGLDDDGNQIIDEPNEGNGQDDDSDGTIDEASETREPNGQDDNGNLLVDEFAELAGPGVDTERFWNGTGSNIFNSAPPNFKNTDASSTAGREARQTYARHLYCLMSALVAETVPPVAAPPTLPVDGAGDAFETQRAIAQWAINVVDFRDRDAIMTPFEFDANPFNADGWATAIDGDPRTVEGGDRQIVWGCERPELLISETISLHDRRTEDLSTDPTGEDTTSNADPMMRDNDYDQRLRPRGDVFVEIFNPWTTGSLKRPAELYYDHNPASGVPGWSNGVLLNKISSGGSPVWRMAVVTGGSRFVDPDTTAPPLDRTVYFVSRGDPRVTVWPSAPAPEKQFTNVGPAAPVKPGRYAVIGGRRRAMVGRRTSAIEGDATTLEVAMTRRIELSPNSDPDVHQVQVLNNGVVTYSDPEVQPATAIVIDNAIDSGVQTPARPFTVTEPRTGYAGGGWDPTLAGGEGAYTTPRDTPLDTAAALQINDTTYDYCRIHLQRLANPMLPWNPPPGTLGYSAALEVNPYMTIDTSSVDMTAFNGVVNDAGDPAATAPARAHFTTFQRGHESTTAPRQRNLWGQAPPKTLAANPKTPEVPGGNHHFNFDLNHTLGFLNQGFQPMFIGGGGPMADAPAPAYAGAPNSAGNGEQAFAWLTWNNRPFVSAHELMLVPRSRSSRLLRTDYTLPTSATIENYGAVGGQFNHLLNFFHDTGTAVNQPVQVSRIFDYLTVPSKYLGAEKWYNPETFTTTTIERTYNVPSPMIPLTPAIAGSDMWKPTNSLRPPFNRLSRFRDPGRVNVNTIFDREVLEGIVKGFPAMDDASGIGVGFWSKFQRSRRDYTGGAATADLSTTHPSRFGNPFRSSFSGQLMPIAAMRENEARASLLRTDPDVPGKPLFSYSSTSAYEHTGRSPYFKYQSISRLSNLLSAHSNVYAVWMTLGLFEVENNPTGVDQVHPDGYRLSREVGIDSAEIKRHRSFYIIDRSIPVAFEPGHDHNTEQTIVLQRFIE